MIKTVSKQKPIQKLCISLKESKFLTNIFTLISIMMEKKQRLSSFTTLMLVCKKQHLHKDIEKWCHSKRKHKILEYLWFLNNAKMPINYDSYV